MRHFNIRATATSVAAVLIAGTAQAEVTAQQVWDNWKDTLVVYGDSGIAIGSETMVGDTLTVTDLAMTMTDPETTVSGTIPQVTFTENGDGTVDVTMSDTYSITIDGGNGDGATVVLANAGFEMTVSGTPEAMDYAYAADRIGVSVRDVTTEGEAMDGDIRLSLNGVEGSYTSRPGDLTEIDYATTAASLDVLVDVTDAAQAMTANVSGQILALDLSGTVALPESMNGESPETMFVDGFAFDAEYSLGQAAYIMMVDDATMEPMNVTASVGGVDVAVAMDIDGVSYDTSLTDMNIDVSGGQVPVPVQVSLGEYAVGFEMPLSASDTPQPFFLNVALADVAVSDMLWSMIDPGAVLPHDPVTIRVALSGMGSLMFDILDPTQSEMMNSAAMPGTLDQISLDALEIDVAGAQVTGDGAFTFDNADTTTFPGFPRPQGELNLSVEGANALLDKLVQMGLVPQDQVMGARMMLGMIATSVGPDSLTSRIEVNDQGHVIANGQRLQ